MKKLLALLFVVNVLISCTSNPYTAKVADTLIVDQLEQKSALLVDSAKALLNDANYWVEKGIKKALPPSKVNSKLNPIMAKYQVVFKQLEPQDSLLVHNYRIEELNKLIDMQVKAMN